MKNSAFVELYRSLSERQRKDIARLAVSVYFSGKRSYQNLLKLLFNICRKYSKTEDILSELKVQSGLERRALWNRLSELNSIAETYFVNEHLKSNRLIRESLLVDSLSERGFAAAAARYVNPLSQFAETGRISSRNYYYSHRIFERASELYFGKGETEKFRASFSNHLAYQAAHFVMEELRQSINCLLQQKDNYGKYESFGTLMLYSEDRIEHLLHEAKKTSPTMYKALRIYYCIYRALSDPKGRAYYEEAKGIFLNSTNIFDIRMKLDLFQTLKDYCVDRTNSGDESFYRESFELNNKILEEGLFGQLYAYSTSTNHFRNFIFAAIRLNRPDWVEKFINDYAVFISERVREDEINISRAILHINNRSYNEALQKLNNVRRKNYLHYLDTSVYRSIVYYETGDIEECYKESARMKDYMRQHREIPVYLRSSYQRFVRRFEELLKLEQRREKTEISRYVNEMESLKNIGMGNWLWQKAKELN